MSKLQQATSNGEGQLGDTAKFDRLSSKSSGITCFDQYQDAAIVTGKGPGVHGSEWLWHVAFGLAEEAGEAAGKFKRIFRDDNGELTEERRQEIIAELGDVLWYVAAMCEELSIPMSEVATRNIRKLQSRKERNVLHGSGDNR